MRQGSLRRLPRLGGVAGLAVLLCAIILVAGRATPLAQGLAGASFIIVSAHAVIALGWREALWFAAICLGVTFTMENIGVLTGFPFGHYAFLVEPEMPHIGVIPPIVGLLYVAMGYPSWIIANLLLSGRVKRPANRLDLVAVPAIGAFVMVQWDLVMDPSGSTLARAWVWHGGGGYFGVPLSNFIGWFLVTYLFYQGFSLLLHARSPRPDYQGRTRGFWALPVLLYLAAGLCHVPPVFDPDTRIVDGGGRVWSSVDLRETAVIVMLCTMLPTSMLALVRLYSGRKEGLLF